MRATSRASSHASCARRSPAISVALLRRRRSSKSELEREARRNDGACHADLLQRTHVDLEQGFDGRRAAAQELVDPELLGRQGLDVGRNRLQPLALECGDDDEATAVVLDVQEGIRNGERHLVPHRGRTGRIGVDQDVGHGQILDTPKLDTVESWSRWSAHASSSPPSTPSCGRSCPPV
jgi:hypothetical protein